MPKIHYSRVITEDPKELKELEKYHRYTHLFQRVRMLSGSYAPRSAAIWERPLRRWATAGLSARGGSQATKRAGSRSCSRAGWVSAAAKSWSRPRPSPTYSERHNG